MNRQALLTAGTILLLATAGCRDGGEGTRSDSPKSDPSTPSGSTSPTAPDPMSGIPAGLPAYFTLGLSNGRISLMKDLGVPWNYRYQYLAGGVNTGEGWATWSDQPGEFAATYLKTSAEAGYIPVLTYDMLRHSKPHPFDGKPDGNLGTAETMKTYYEDWKLLMQKCGAFGKTVIIHVEPDLSGYMQQQHGTNPADVSVKVASSGFAEAAGFPDNAIGFAQLLIKLRDTYAPKTLLAWHVSTWANNLDATKTDPSPVDSGRKVTDFYKALKANYDLLFFDPADRTAGFYEYVRGDSNRWWNDEAFSRFRQYVLTVTEGTGKKAMLWQVPIGNTLYRSCNNTRSHYQDNRVQYFLQEGSRSHIVEYAKAGVIGILFGAGGEGDTTAYDFAKDGITNPEPVRGNTLTSAYPDDDGGFLRLSATAYYAAGPVRIP